MSTATVPSLYAFFEVMRSRPSGRRSRRSWAASWRNTDVAGFTIVGAHDIPGRYVVALIQQDQPFLVEREIRHAKEPVLLLPHEDREVLRAARVELAVLLLSVRSSILFRIFSIGDLSDWA